MLGQHGCVKGRVMIPLIRKEGWPNIFLDKVGLYKLNTSKELEKTSFWCSVLLESSCLFMDLSSVVKPMLAAPYLGPSRTKQGWLVHVLI